jgi:TonB family protein
MRGRENIKPMGNSKVRRYHLVRTFSSARAVTGVVLGILISVAAVRSQDNSTPREGVPPELVALTHQVVSKIPQTDRSAVLVLDFNGPDESSSPFGVWLADQFSLAIAKSDKMFVTIDRAKLAEALDARHISRKAPLDAKTEANLAASLGAHTSVMGSFVAAENGIGATILVRSLSQIGYGVPPSELVRGKIPFTGIVAGGLGMPLASLRPKDGIFAPGGGGVNPPLCISCPRANFPRSAIPAAHKPNDGSFNGTVELMTVVTAEGNVTNVAVTKSLGSEFDAAAVAAVSRWRLKPAVDIDGNPIPVHQKIEVTFSSF